MPAIRSLRLVAWAASSAARRSLVLERRRRSGPGPVRRCATRSCTRARSSARAAASGAQPVALGHDLRPERFQLPEVRREQVGRLPQVGHHGPEKDGAPHRRQRVLGPHEHRRRRPVADPLQRGQHLGQDRPPLDAAMPSAPSSLPAQRREAPLGRGDLLLQVLDPPAGVEERLGEGGAVLVERLDLRPELGRGARGETAMSPSIACSSARRALASGPAVPASCPRAAGACAASPAASAAASIIAVHRLRDTAHAPGVPLPGVTRSPTLGRRGLTLCQPNGPRGRRIGAHPPGPPEALGVGPWRRPGAMIPADCGGTAVSLQSR
jgi:hypothetical protein